MRSDGSIERVGDDMTIFALLALADSCVMVLIRRRRQCRERAARMMRSLQTALRSDMRHEMLQQTI
jgi:hypothetical protein